MKSHLAEDTCDSALHKLQLSNTFVLIVATLSDIEVIFIWFIFSSVKTKHCVCQTDFLMYWVDTLQRNVRINCYYGSKLEAGFVFFLKEHSKMSTDTFMDGFLQNMYQTHPPDRKRSYLLMQNSKQCQVAKNKQDKKTFQH